MRDTGGYAVYQDDGGEVLVLYQNGDLQDWWDAGDTDTVIRLIDALGIPLTTTNDVLLGARAADVVMGDADPAQTIHDIEEWTRTEEFRLEEADRLELQADQLRERAARLRGDNYDD